jgi:rod shape-determining protein MreC
MSFGGEKRPSGSSRFIAPLVIIALNLLLFVGASTPPVQALQGVVGSVARFTSEPFGAIGRASATFAAGFGDVRALRSKLSAALVERDQYAAEATRIADLEREIADLRAALDVQATSSFTTVAGQVVARDFAIDRRVVVIDRGSNDGIAVGDVVIGAGGALAGRVIDVLPTSSRVRLVSDPAFRVTAEIAASGAIGLLSGSGSNPLAFEDVDALREVTIGAAVTTSGIELTPELRSAFPRGLSIGTIAAVSGQASAVLQSADVTPTLPIDSIRTLLVITNFRGGLPIPSAAP